MQIAALTPTIGAQITGINPGAGLAGHELDAIYDALMEHQVIFFSGVEIDPAAHLALACSFGELNAPNPLYSRVDGYDHIVRFANDANSPPDTDGWHTDMTFRQEPPFASLLVARELPPVGGDTLWTSMYAAWDALDENIQTYLRSLSAVHDMGDFRNNFSVGETTGEKVTEGMHRFGSAVHPVVQTHPVTGREYLYVNESFTQHIVGMTARASRRLLSYLFDHIARPEYQVRFKWSPGAMAIWDNRCTQHYAVADYLPARREMHRITVIRDRRAVGSVAATEDPGDAAA